MLRTGPRVTSSASRLPSERADLSCISLNVPRIPVKRGDAEKLSRDRTGSMRYMFLSESANRRHALKACNVPVIGNTRWGWFA